MAESIQHAVQLPASAGSLPGEAPRPPQGTVTAHGTLAVYEPGSGKLVGEVRVSRPRRFTRRPRARTPLSESGRASRMGSAARC